MVFFPSVSIMNLRPEPKVDVIDRNLDYSVCVRPASQLQNYSQLLLPSVLQAAEVIATI